MSNSKELANFYNGIENLKKSGTVELNDEQTKEYTKCALDPIYFIENYVYINTLDNGVQLFKLYDCQKDKIKTIHENRFSIVLEPRQNGKCCLGSTLVNIKNKKTGEIKQVTMRDLHDFHNI